MTEWFKAEQYISKIFLRFGINIYKFTFLLIFDPPESCRGDKSNGSSNVT
jgi:hypothetical protein